MNKKQFELSVSQRRRRHFSKEFKIKKVKELELGKVKVSELCKAYELSATSVYRWIDYYGSTKHKPERLIMESKSETAKVLNLEKKIAELERLIGQKQVLIDFQMKMIELAEKEYGIDIKKKSESKH